MAEFLTKDSYAYRNKEANAKREHYKNQAAYNKAKGNKSESDAANAMANMAEQESEIISQRQLKENSRAQYQHEKEQGDPYANKMSFEDWKKL